MKEVKNDPPYVYTTKVMIPTRSPLTFGMPQ